MTSPNNPFDESEPETKREQSVRPGDDPAGFGSGSAQTPGDMEDYQVEDWVSSPAPAAPARESAPEPSGQSEPVAALPPRPPSPTHARMRDLFERLKTEISKTFVGQDDFVQGTLVALLSGGHVLIESVPGLGKTLLVRVLSRVLGCKFNRIQFTPDLMPSDITGQPIFDMRDQEFRFRPGPIFTQLLLADEINRSPAKTHAALLEIMQEYRVTVDGQTYDLQRPFLVLATQNPIESEGTYNLPEAQLDRFMFKVSVEYPKDAEESDILRLHRDHADLNEELTRSLNPVTNPEEINAAYDICSSVTVDDKIIDYISGIVRKTRQWPGLFLGASPRAGIALLKGTRTLAAFSGRDYVTPDDVADLVLPALRHRVILAPEAEVEGRRPDDVLTELLRTIEVPRL